MKKTFMGKQEKMNERSIIRKKRGIKRKGSMKASGEEASVKRQRN